jgi:DNA-binding transcriptional LysR family regulator
MMNVKDLRTFLSVAELGSVTLAAEALEKSQPSVSRCIQDLETELGFALLDRVGRRVSLSPEGAAFEEEARRLVSAFDSLPERTRARASGSAQPLSISATSALGTGLVPHALARWDTKDRPQDIHIVQGVPNAVAQDLLTGRARIGLASLPLDVPGITCLRAYSASLVIALPSVRADEFPEDKPVSLSDIANGQLVTMLDRTRLQGRIAQAIAEVGVPAESTIRVNSTVTALELVRLSGAIAIVEPITAIGAPPQGVVTRPLVEDIRFDFGFFSADGSAAPRASQQFFDHCEAALMTLLPDVKRITPPAIGKSGEQA